LSPHFTGTIPLSAEQSRTLRAGQRGVTWFGRGRETIGELLTRQLRSNLPSDLQWIGDVICLDFKLTTPKCETEPIRGL
jgi:hypothetical protein